MVFLGKPTKKEENYYNLLLNCQQTTVEQIRENELFVELDRWAKKCLGKFKNKFIHSLGHGIGIEVHEAPIFSNKNWPIKQKMVFTIEPGIYFKNKFGLRIEDTLVFNGKPRILTKVTKELLKIGIKP